ncbi:hypothetical protein BDV59DRAFT_203297 [Aspergillus ambiguus]|uniref:uncharacterized protein n=1 Tax=Aspergillus ambiguus TaxID=176160 RepID=UPI003CCCB9EF
MSGIGQRDIIPATKKPALFKVAEPEGYPLGAEPPVASNRLVYNTDDASTLERFKIREICEGWPLHRDACEWTDLRSIFDPKAFINISWQQNYRDQAIETWAKGWKRGDYITHQWDADNDVRFVFFLKKQPQGWQILCNHPIYEKDKCVPVDPTNPPKIDHESLAKEPKGYMFLAYGMRRLGYPIKQNSPNCLARSVTNCIRKWWSG